MELSVNRNIKNYVNKGSPDIRKYSSVLCNRKSPATPKYSSQNLMMGIQSEKKHNAQERQILNNKLMMELNGSSKKQGVVQISLQKSSPYFSANSKKIVEKQLTLIKPGGYYNQNSKGSIPKQTDSRKKTMLMNKSRNILDRNTNQTHSHSNSSKSYQQHQNN